MADLSELTASVAVDIAAGAELLYDMITDIARMGEWSPVTKRCWWDEGASAEVGQWFTGHNDNGEREWDTHCQVVVAERPEEFAWIVGGIDEGYVRWGYTFTPIASGTRVEEFWSVVRLNDRLATADGASLRERTVAGMRTTLENLKHIAEASKVAAD